MAAPNTNSTSTAVVTRDEKKPLPTELQAQVDAAKLRRQMAQAIRGAQWGKDLDQNAIAAVTRYCIENNLDPVRHVEILGGKLYLTAEFYDERGAPLIRAGIVHPEEPDFINVDPRLDAMAAEGDEWAKAEQLRRKKARIQYNAPEEAKATVVQKFILPASGKAVVGVNWCGGGTRKKMGQGGKIYDGDPIGDLEPTKTAQTRARRRAWKQIADVLPDYGAIVNPLEEAAARMELPVAVVEHKELPRPIAGAEDPYRLAAGAPAAAPVTQRETETVDRAERQAGDGEPELFDGNRAE